MKFIKFFIIIFITFSTPIKADLNKNLIDQLDKGGKLIFIRHAYAPGNGDPINFNLNDCSTQRNLSNIGRKQAQYIGAFFRENKIKIDKVLSSEWCRCKETAKIAFDDYSTNSFLNSFYSSKYAKNKDKQIKELNNYIKKYESNENLVFVTHYVLISEVLNYGPSSGEIVVSDKNFNMIGSIEINY
ncbi:MAG: histidine phosphatase family protein [Rhodobiaceae bacterium]|nr:histidine phosphatase family protein [Rhodobiaceae bacterium]|tara:strand:+ start:362 stop:919 length:558 start_codon:yes stop_codon:yes gene_type:complete